jgi:hypothetical protein
MENYKVTFLHNNCSKWTKYDKVFIFCTFSTLFSLRSAMLRIKLNMYIRRLITFCVILIIIIFSKNHIKSVLKNYLFFD